MIDLNSLIAAASGWILTEAYAINDRGEIVGSGLLNGVEQAFRLDYAGGSAILDPSLFRLPRWPPRSRAPS